MAKEATKRAGTAAAESLLHALMPQLLDRLERLEKKIDGGFTDIDHRLTELKRDMDDRFEQTRDVINELAQRIAKVDGKLEAFVEMVRHQNALIEKWVERTVKVETLQQTRRRKAS
jgi:flagellar hook-associated protein FlgK